MAGDPGLTIEDVLFADDSDARVDEELQAWHQSVAGRTA